MSVNDWVDMDFDVHTPESSNAKQFKFIRQFADDWKKIALYVYDNGIQIKATCHQDHTVKILIHNDDYNFFTLFSKLMTIIRSMANLQEFDFSTRFPELKSGFFKKPIKGVKIIRMDHMNFMTTRFVGDAEKIYVTNFYEGPQVFANKLEMLRKIVANGVSVEIENLALQKGHEMDIEGVIAHNIEYADDE